MHDLRAQVAQQKEFRINQLRIKLFPPGCHCNKCFYVSTSESDFICFSYKQWI